jgi:hypothetical protein
LTWDREAESAKPTPSNAKQSTGPAQAKEDSEQESDAEWEINDIECFISFIKTAFKKDFHKRVQLENKELAEVFFGDLHRLFLSPANSFVAGCVEDVLRAFQVIGVDLPRHSVLADCNAGAGEGKALGKPDSPKGLQLHLFYLDFDGTRFSPSSHVVDIPHYEGTRPITSLQVFPISFLSDYEKGLLNCRGKRFLNYATTQVGGKGAQGDCFGLTLSLIDGSKEEVTYNPHQLPNVSSYSRPTCFGV